MKSGRKLLEGILIVKLAVIFPLIIFFGCATKDAVRNLSDEDILRERVMAYWSNRVNRAFDKAFEYEYNPEYKTKERYVGAYSNPTIGVKSFSADSIVINKEDDSASVALTIVSIFKAPGVKAFEPPMTITERWVRVKELWYHIH